MSFRIFFNGTVMRGQPDHANLKDARFLMEAQTAPIYALYSIHDRHPGMFEIGEGGISVPGEVYEVSEETWLHIEATEPENLYRGTVTLADGSQIYGMLYPRELAEGKQRNISEFGGWLKYLASREG